MSQVKDFLNSDEEKSILEAIQEAEKNTSGEIRVHIENCKPNNQCMQRAEEVFFMLNMDKTNDKNGVLFYVAVNKRKFAVIGDEGIDKVVPDDFWDSIKNRVTSEFAKGNYADGLVLGILETGQKLKQFFPYQKDDINELPDEISMG